MVFVLKELSWGRVHLEKLRVAQLVKICLGDDRDPMSITVFLRKVY
jgi:hypothetical protein